jgi:hypothetical protein
MQPELDRNPVDPQLTEQVWRERAAAVASYLEHVVGLSLTPCDSPPSPRGWSGEIVLEDGPYIAAYDPKTRAILVAPSKVHPDEPLATYVLVHELLHAAAAPLLFMTNRDYAAEEAWAAAYARHIVARLASEQPEFRGLDVAALDERLALHPYRRLISMMETVRLLTGLSHDAFYRPLALSPGAERWRAIADMIGLRYVGVERAARLREFALLQDRVSFHVFAIDQLVGGVR